MFFKCSSFLGTCYHIINYYSTSVLERLVQWRLPHNWSATKRKGGGKLYVSYNRILMKSMHWKSKNKNIHLYLPNVTRRERCCRLYAGCWMKNTVLVNELIFYICHLKWNLCMNYGLSPQQPFKILSYVGENQHDICLINQATGKVKRTAVCFPGDWLLIVRWSDDFSTIAGFASGK